MWKNYWFSLRYANVRLSELDFQTDMCMYLESNTIQTSVCNVRKSL